MTVSAPPRRTEPIGVRELASKLHVGEGTVRRKAKAGIWQSVIVDGHMRFADDTVQKIVAECRAAAAEAEKNND